MNIDLDSRLYILSFMVLREGYQTISLAQYMEGEFEIIHSNALQA